METSASRPLEPKAWAQLTGRGRGHEQKLPFKWRAAEEIRQIDESRNQRVVRYSAQLPLDWKVIYLFTTLSDGELERASRESLSEQSSLASGPSSGSLLGNGANSFVPSHLGMLA
jgi:hypothetical protein